VCVCVCDKQEPILSAEQPAFQYSSHVSLQAPSGHMWWVFFCFFVLFLSSFVPWKCLFPVIWGGAWPSGQRGTPKVAGGGESSFFFLTCC
jgi:hypothetical protein